MANVITNSGEQWSCDRMSGVSALDGHFIHWGTGAGTAAKADTDVFTAASESRAVGTASTVGTNAAAVYQCVGTLTANAGKTITNAATFTASTAGICILKGDFTGIALNLNDSITFTFTLDPS